MAEKREEGRMCAWKRTAYQVKRLGGNKLKKKKKPLEVVVAHYSEHSRREPGV
jgi:hypothetical protein